MSYSKSAPKPFTKYGVGLHNVGSYQVSGMPWVTGSADLDSAKVHMVQFPYVTKKVTVKNISSENKFILVHFQSGSATIDSAGPPGVAFANDNPVYKGFHYVPVAMASSIEMNVKCTKLFISNLTAEAAFGSSATNNLAYVVSAELTNIPTSRMPHLTGSGITDAQP